MNYNEMLVVPIIENTPHERDLKDRMAQAMQEYPETCAVLVRRHGVYGIVAKIVAACMLTLVLVHSYVWGDNWVRAKTMTECYDYLFEIAVKMKQAVCSQHSCLTARKGLNPEEAP